MRLTTFSDYNIRVLIYMGMYPDKLITINELAEHYEISHNHLTKVIHYLGQQGYIETQRGKGGGIRLLKQPEDINIGKLIRDTEKNSALAECFNKDNCNCKILPACRLAGIFHEAQDAFYSVLEKYTVADLLVNSVKLKKLLVVNG